MFVKIVENIILAIYSAPITSAWFIGCAFCVLIAARSGIINSPTLKSRRIMLASYYRNIAILFVIVGIFLILFTYFLSPIRGNPILTAWVRFFYQAMLCAAPLYCFITSLRTNILWNNSLKCPLQTEEQANDNSDARNSVFAFMPSYFAAIASLFFAFLPASIYYIFFFTGSALLMPYVCPVILLFTILLLFCFHRFIALPLVKDDSSLLRSPPRIKDIHSILTGEKNISGFNKNERIHFGGDTVWVWTSCVFAQGIVYRDYFEESVREASAYPAILGFLLSFFVLVLFTLFFDGIPRKRYWGFIFVAASLFIINVFCYILIRNLPITPDLLRPPHQFLIQTVLPLSILSGMTASGISGLLVFRQKGSCGFLFLSKNFEQ